MPGSRTPAARPRARIAAMKGWVKPILIARLSFSSRGFR
jgi:hypothetical protein